MSGLYLGEITAEKLLIHPWLLNNTEPRTERFICRAPPPISIQPSYYRWPHHHNILEEDVHPELYAPFGTHSNERVFNETTLEWEDSPGQPIYGAANATDILGLR